MWIFDQSSGPNGFAPDPLVASRMNVNPTGKQPKMHDTVKPNGELQRMVDASGDEHSAVYTQLYKIKH